ncbi:MAG: HAMP domain-containing sensor histidine kinase [Chloroflexota bacterium]
MSDAHQQARAKLSELIENAKKGAIIPVRLPGQLEEIAALLDAEETADGPPSSGDADIDALVHEQAEFISTAVHELRTPMTSIRGYSDMLGTPSMGELNPMQQQFLDTIRTNTKRMEGLLQDISDISKLQGDVLRLTEKMDMFKNIAGIIEKETAPVAEEYNKPLTFDIPQGLPLLNTDGEYFAKAIRKFVENGVKYSGEDGEVTVRAHADDGTLVVEVEDNGIGMSDEELGKIGTIYWRSDNEAVREHKGSGLGTAIAFGILDQLGAKYTIESTDGEGTKITVRIAGMT